MTTVKKMVMTAICTAMCVVLPLVFHWIPNAGSVILPMHIPVLLCGFPNFGHSPIHCPVHCAKWMNGMTESVCLIC